MTPLTAACAEIARSEHDLAVQDTTAALSLDPDNLKSLLRRALAYVSLDEPGKAETDLRSLLDTDPDVVPAPLPVHFCSPLWKVARRGALSESMRRLALNAMGTVRAAKSAEQPPEYAGGLCQPDQSLRLNLRQPLPTAVPIGSWVSVSLCTTNEFGLFQHGSLGTEPPTIECRCIMSLNTNL